MKYVRLLGLAFCLFAIAGFSLAQNYPTKPVRFVVP